MKITIQRSKLDELKLGEDFSAWCEKLSKELGQKGSEELTFEWDALAVLWSLSRREHLVWFQVLTDRGILPKDTLDRADLTDALYPTGPLPRGWGRINERGVLVRDASHRS